jgi:hypothetical protein
MARYDSDAGFPVRLFARDDRLMTANFEATAFGSEWNALDRAERLRIRRLVRMGRVVEPPELAHLAPGYAKWQMQRPWMRFFPLWFVPGIIVVLGAAARIHPILLGVTIALGAQAVWAYVSLRRAAHSDR